MHAADVNLIRIPPGIVTTCHFIWFVLSAFRLLNLVVGTIVNNYQIIMEETRRKEEAEKARKEAEMAAD